MNDFPRDDTVSVQFPRQQWDHILVLLAHRPFNEVAGVITEIQRQCQTHEMRRRVEASTPRLAPEDYGPVEPKAAE